MLSKIFDTKMALGSNTDIVLISSNASSSEKLMTKLWRHIFEFEKRFSRFLPASELSLFNKNAGIKTPISIEFRDILLSAKTMSKKSNGLYNPFILPSLQRSGYLNSRAEGYENDPVDDYRNRGIADIDGLIINRDSAEIPFNSAIDLGGIGKGYLADQLAEQINQEPHIDGFFVSLGGDMVVGGNDVDGSPWHIGVQSAENSDNELNIFINNNFQQIAVATSGTLSRSNSNKKNKHIIDPRNLKPANTDIKLITLASKSAILCDVMASCAVILGSKNAPDFIHEQEIENFIIQYENNHEILIKSNGELIHNKERSYA